MNARFSTLEDSSLIQLSLAGQTECFEVLINRHLTAIRRRIGPLVRNTADMDDAIQDILLKVWRHLASFRSESSFRTWMTRVAINEVLQSHRRGRCRPACQPFSDLDGKISSLESPHQYVVHQEKTQQVQSAIAALPSKYQQVLIMRDLEERSIQETAQSLGSSIPAIKTRLYRARLLVASRLTRTKVGKLPVQARSQGAFPGPLGFASKSQFAQV